MLRESWEVLDDSAEEENSVGDTRVLVLVVTRDQIQTLAGEKYMVARNCDIWLQRW